MGGNGAGSRTANMTANRIAAVLGVPAAQVRASARFLVQTGAAANMAAALGQIQQTTHVGNDVTCR